MTSFSLTQVVDEPTHLGANGTSSLIDLVLMSAPQSLVECTTVTPLLSSLHPVRYHLGVFIWVDVPSCNPQPRQRRRDIWRYQLADFHKASELLRNLNIEAIFADADVDACWLSWKQAFLNIMDTCIPKLTHQTGKVYPGWLKRLYKPSRREIISIGLPEKPVTASSSVSTKSLDLNNLQAPPV